MNASHITLLPPIVTRSELEAGSYNLSRLERHLGPLLKGLLAELWLRPDA